MQPRTSDYARPPRLLFGTNLRCATSPVDPKAAHGTVLTSKRPKIGLFRPALNVVALNVGVRTAPGAVQTPKIDDFWVPENKFS